MFIGKLCYLVWNVAFSWSAKEVLMLRLFSRTNKMSVLGIVLYSGVLRFSKLKSLLTKPSCDRVKRMEFDRSEGHGAVCVLKYNPRTLDIRTVNNILVPI